MPSPSVDGGEHDATPDPSSEHAKLTLTSVLFQPLPFGAGVAPPTIVGAVSSMRIVMSVVVVLPAWSVIVCASVVKPSAPTTWSPGHDVTPDRSSLHVQCTVTGPLYQPSGAGGTEAVSVGGVWSTLMPFSVVELELPAVSVALPVTDCPAPSFESVVGSAHVATPDS